MRKAIKSNKSLYNDNQPNNIHNKLLKFHKVSFSPNVIFSQLPLGPIKQSTSCELDGAILMVDISGFSSYASDLSAQGKFYKYFYNIYS